MGNAAASRWVNDGGFLASFDASAVVSSHTEPLEKPKTSSPGEKRCLTSSATDSTTPETSIPATGPAMNAGSL